MAGIVSYSMIAQRSPDNNGPLTWMGSFPVYASTVLAGVHGVTLILTALAMAAGAEGFLQMVVFSSSAISTDWALWQPVTYAFVHVPPYWFFLIELYLLVVFGKEIEGYLGRRGFLQLYTLLLIAPTLLLTFADLIGWSTTYAGSSALHFGVFVAFALIYPTAEMFFGIQAKWIALALLAINSLQCLAISDYTALSVLAVDCVIACLFIGFHQGRFAIRMPERRFRVVKSPEPVRSVARNEFKEADIEDMIDPILDKISKSGLSSLTIKERERLEQARARLIAKDSGR